MMNFLAHNSTFVAPALMAVLGGIALAIDVAFVRPRRRRREGATISARERSPR